MAIRYLNKKTHYFYFHNEELNKRKHYVLIFGDELNTKTGDAPSGADWQNIEYRGRIGEVEKKKFSISNNRSLEMYFLDVGQGDAAFIVTPQNQKILVDGGLKDRALGFLIWKYRLDKNDTVKVVIDYLILSHGDKDHVEGLIRILKHPQIEVKHIFHNGIGVFDSGFNEKIGKKENGILKTFHSNLDELNDLDLEKTFGQWIQEVKNSNATYEAIDHTKGNLDINELDIEIEILGPILEPDGKSFKWFTDKAHTINGHSVVFRLIYKNVRTFFSGDLNVKGSKHLLKNSEIKSKLDSHIFKSPHHGSHEFHFPLFQEISPIVSIVSSGDSPDHGHPRAEFLGALGLAGRSRKPLIFSTEIASTFVDAGDKESVEGASSNETSTLGDLNFSDSSSNRIARRRFKKVLPGIINVRTDGDDIYCARRVVAGYQWESLGPIKPIDK